MRTKITMLEECGKMSKKDQRSILVYLRKWVKWLNVNRKWVLK